MPFQNLYMSDSLKIYKCQNILFPPHILALISLWSAKLNTSDQVPLSELRGGDDCDEVADCGEVIGQLLESVQRGQ